MSKAGVWCYFCNRSFADEDGLITHQKMTHFRCPICRRSNRSTAALSNHVSLVHKEILEKVPNAIEGRDSPNNSVFGMKGIPENVYVAWLTSVDADFKEHAKGVSLEGAFLANEATRFAAMSHAATAANITYNQFNQFHRGNVQVNQGLGTVITAKGVVSADSLQTEKKTVVREDSAAVQRRYDLAMRRAKEIVDEAVTEAARDRKKKWREQRKKEVRFFVPVDGLSVHELRAKFLREKRAT
jgi:hypothetical protein